MPDQRQPERRTSDADRGSVTPLVLGMMLCLLLLGAGVIAAGSAVLARRNLQSICDGATNYAAGSTTPEEAAGGDTGRVGQLMANYLNERPTGATVEAGVTADAVFAHCQIEAPITFGALFLNPTVHLDVNSSSKIERAVG